MPGGDGTGPAGMGPMTGRAAGYCAGYQVPGYANPLPGRGWGRGRGGWGRGMAWGRPWGAGRGRGMGWGRGWRMGAAYPSAFASVPYAESPAYSDAAEVTPQQEAQMLKQEAKGLQEELKLVNGRIAELERVIKAEKK